MNLFLTLAFLFSVGSIIGWIIELFFRKYFSSSNPNHKWINPGFLRGPYLPLYGFVLCILYFLSKINLNFIPNLTIQHFVLFGIMAIVITFVEYIAGIIFIKGMKVKLWDYSKLKGNIQGIICPQFTFFWFLLSVFYYIFIEPYINDAVFWLSKNLSFTFLVGFYYGIFTIDLFYSIHILSKIKKFADEHKIVIKYEALKNSIRNRNEEIKDRINFFFFLKSEKTPLTENLKKYIEKEREKLKDMLE